MQAWFVIVGLSGCTTLGSAIDRLDGCVPGSEICLDGIDNDCDDIIDEPACTPEWLLDGGVCGAERCGNGVDDDCDEQVDELCDQACTEIAADVIYVIDSSSGEIRVSGVPTSGRIPANSFPPGYCLTSSGEDHVDFVAAFVIGEDGRYAQGGAGGSRFMTFLNCGPALCSTGTFPDDTDLGTLVARRGDTITIVFESINAEVMSIRLRYLEPIP